MAGTPQWLEALMGVFAGLGFAVTVIACIFAVWLWRDNAPMRRFRKRLRAAKKAAGQPTPAPGAGEQEEGT